MSGKVLLNLINNIYTHKRKTENNKCLNSDYNLISCMVPR